MTGGAPPCDVAIVGCGPTGATLANLCGQRGLRTLVIERSDAPYAQPRACHLDAEVARILQGAGFAGHLDDLLTVSAGMEYVGPDGRRLFTFEDFERAPLLGWHEDYVFVQPELELVLRAGLARYPDVEVRLGEPAPPIGELLGEARFVVACDGASSSVRQELGIDLVDLGYDEEWLVVDVVVQPGRGEHLPRIIQQVCDPDRPATFVPSHGRHRRWELHLAPSERPDPWALLARWGMGPEDGELVRAVTYRFHALVAEHWRGGPGGRVLLAGDAAHQMPPFMGQGMCSGIRDAANLAWRLEGVLRHGQPVALLDGYEAERRPHTEAVIALSIQAGRLIHELAADLAGGRAPRLPAPDHLDPRRWSRLPGLDLGAPFPVGHQLPQPDRLDERLGLGWSVVTSTPLAPAAVVSAARAAGAWGEVPVVVEPRATYGERALLVRPDRYIAASLA